MSVKEISTCGVSVSAELPDVLHLLAAKGGCPASLNPPRACRARFLNLPERRQAFASADPWDP